MPLNPLEIAAQIVALSNCGLFDAQWYRTQNQTMDGDPLVHFCNSGWARGWQPNLYFDCHDYLKQHPDVPKDGLDPLFHYFEHGEALDWWPGPHFDPGWYRAVNGLAPGVSCLADYLARRRRERISPNPGFDAQWYGATYEIDPDRDAFEVYMGMTAGRHPSRDARIIAKSGLFDPVFYLRRVTALADGEDPLYHFCRAGWRLEQRNPNEVFDTAWYLQANDDVRDAGRNPLAHYVEFGEPENRAPSLEFDVAAYRAANQIPPGESCLRHFLQSRADAKRAKPAPAPVATQPAVAAAPREPNTLYDDELALQSGLFDTNYYLINYPDVRQSTLHPVEHFRMYGWREGRRPNPYFDPLWYSATYLGGHPAQNPLLDYISLGERNGRRPIVYFDPGWYVSHYQLPAGGSPLRHFLEHRRSQKYGPTPKFDPDWYMRSYGTMVGANRDPFAHYLRVGISQDLDPGPDFDAKAYRSKMPPGPPRANPVAGAQVHDRLRREELNPLVHFLLHEGTASAVRAAE